MKINQKRMIQPFMEFVSIDSPSRHERHMADWLTFQLRGIGFVVCKDDAGSIIGGD